MACITCLLLASPKERRTFDVSRPLTRHIAHVGLFDWDWPLSSKNTYILSYRKERRCIVLVVVLLASCLLLLLLRRIGEPSVMWVSNKEQAHQMNQDLLVYKTYCKLSYCVSGEAIYGTTSRMYCWLASLVCFSQRYVNLLRCDSVTRNTLWGT